jgi:hypothetical protein
LAFSDPAGQTHLLSMQVILELCKSKSGPKLKEGMRNKKRTKKKKKRGEKQSPTFQSQKKAPIASHAHQKDPGSTETRKGVLLFCFFFFFFFLPPNPSYKKTYYLLRHGQG